MLLLFAAVAVVIGGGVGVVFVVFMVVGGLYHCV